MRVTSLVLVAMSLCISGCYHHVRIVPVGEDRVLPQAQVRASGKLVGTGPTDLEIDRETSISISEPSGQWFSKTITVGMHSPAKVRVYLQPDELFRATTDDNNRVVNRWITISVSDTARKSGTWWSSIISAISSQNFELELMDRTSGFLRTSWRETAFPSARIRRRFVGNTVTESPLQWRIRYEVQYLASDNQWYEYPRGFRDELDALAEARARIQ